MAFAARLGPKLSDLESLRRAGQRVNWGKGSRRNAVSVREWERNLSRTPLKSRSGKLGHAQLFSLGRIVGLPDIERHMIS